MLDHVSSCKSPQQMFGAIGGVMEAALRTAVEKLGGEELVALEFTEVRGMNGIKEAAYEVDGITIKVAAVSGLANANALLTRDNSIWNKCEYSDSLPIIIGRLSELHNSTCSIVWNRILSSYTCYQKYH